MNKFVVVVLAIFFCFISFLLGHGYATRKERANLLATTKSIAIWRESDWQTSSIQYSKIIQSIEAGKTSAAIDVACREIARNEKRILQIHPIIDDSAPVIRAPPPSACEGRSPAR